MTKMLWFAVIGIYKSENDRSVIGIARTAIDGRSRKEVESGLFKTKGCKETIVGRTTGYETKVAALNAANRHKIKGW